MSKLFTIIGNCPACGKKMLYFPKQDIYYCLFCGTIWERNDLRWIAEA